MNKIKLIKLKKHTDKRGLFRRIFCKRIFKKINSFIDVKQINLSTNPKKGTLRGLHYQKGNFSEKKIIFCTKGKLFFVALNIDPKSKNYLKYESFTLNEKDDFALFVDNKYATGFLTLSKNTELLYLMSNFFNPESARGIKYNDPKIKIKWPMKPLIISSKDKKINHL
jgi:dTDP-4-dehydrorhamnose 3,5-epimerase